MRNCIFIIRDSTGKKEVDELAIEILNIIYARGGDYSIETMRAFAEVYLR